MALAERLSKVDTLSELERAAARGWRDAEQLRRGGRRLAAIYLYGYTVETRIKCGYFRSMGFRPDEEITPEHRDTARRDYSGSGLDKKPWHHDISGWARLLVHRRIIRKKPHPTNLRDEIINNADRVQLNWQEIIRYRATAVRATELDEVRSKASWFRDNYQLLYE